MKPLRRIISESSVVQRRVAVAVLASGALLMGTSLMMYSSPSPPEVNAAADHMAQDGNRGEQQKRLLLAEAQAPIQSRQSGAAVNGVASADEDSIEPFLVQTILDEIELDEEGSPIVNDGTRRLLESAMLMLGSNHGQFNLDLLDQLIRAGLPGPPGEEAANVFRSYYEYKAAEGELAASVTVSNFTSGRAAYDHIVQLRQGYLGYELAGKLFAEEDAFMRKTLQAMKEAEADTPK